MLPDILPDTVSLGIRSSLPAHSWNMCNMCNTPRIFQGSNFQSQ